LIQQEFIVKFEHRHHRAEYFLAHDAHLVLTLVEQRRRDEESPAKLAAHLTFATGSHPQGFPKMGRCSSYTQVAESS
jgi:hypothetical protein